jgi:hypothetical protein
MATIAERVARGAAYLDEREPGWDERIDLETLDLYAPCRCVLGQLATDLNRWGDVRARFGLRAAWMTDSRPTADALGFNVPDGEQQIHRQYLNLTAAWRELIEARRAA